MDAGAWQLPRTTLPLQKQKTMKQTHARVFMDAAPRALRPKTDAHFFVSI